MKKNNLRMIFIFVVLLTMALSACTPVSSQTTEEPTQALILSDSTELPQESLPPAENAVLTVSEVEKQAGFDVKEPTYLPSGVSFQTAVFQNSPNPMVILQYKLVHEQFGEMGAFFQITEESLPEAPADVLACVQADGCEMLQIGDLSVVYHLNPAGPEGLDWYKDGLVFRLLRTAGEPNKIYKDELVKVIESMQ